MGLRRAWLAWRDSRFMADRVAIEHTVNPLSEILLFAVVVLLVTALIWANFAMLDEVTRGEGKVVPSRDIQRVQNLEGGIISEILVEAGSLVEAGDILLRIDDTLFTSSFQENRAERSALEARIARLRAETEDREMEIPGGLAVAELNLYQAERSLWQERRRELETTLAVLAQQAIQIEQQQKELVASQGRIATSLRLANQELSILAPMLTAGVVSELGVLRLQRQINDLEGQLEMAATAIVKAEAALAENRGKVSEVKARQRSQAREALNGDLLQLRLREESMTALRDRVQRTAVRSPVRGVVKQLLVRTIGGVVQPGSDLVEIVPIDDRLLIEGNIRPADIAFIHPGQQAMVKFTAYDFAIYGGLKAELSQISADTIVQQSSGESFYRILLRTDNSELHYQGRSLPIIPGMVVTIEILTGRKSVLDYLLKPILKTRQIAMTER
jgi:membrane fusion protein, adhesin transport system